MKHVKTLILAFALMFVLATSAFAGETNSPPCVPGETHSPPCPSQSVIEEPAIADETQTPLPLVDATDITEAVLWALSLF